MANERTPGTGNEDLGERDLEKLAEELADEEIEDLAGGQLESPSLGEAGANLGEAG
jgi:hypothetical protein